MQSSKEETRASYIEEAETLPTYNLLPPERERDYTDFAPLYESHTFRNRFNWYPILHHLSASEKAIVTSYEFERGPAINDGWGTGDTRWDINRNHRVKRTFH